MMPGKKIFKPTRFAEARVLCLQFWMLVSNPDYRLIRKAAIFDKDYYLQKNPDLAGITVDLLSHFVRWGGTELRPASIFFDPQYYLSQLSADRSDNINPLVHFLTEGWRVGKNPNLLFSVDYYLSRYPKIRDLNVNPLLYYLDQGWKLAHCTSPEMEFFLEDTPVADLIERNINPLAHFLNRKEYPCFDPCWYLDQTPSLAQVTDEYWEHYKKYGADEGKSPLPVFDPHFYRLNNPQIPAGYKDLYFHYLSKKRYEHLRPSKWFDPVFYSRQIPPDERRGMTPLEHYLKKGVFEQRYTDERISALPEKPLISVIVPVYNVNPHYLNNCIRSVLYQVYPHWELCIVDDCSTDSHVRPQLKSWEDKDDRIKTTYLEENSGISGATARAVESATGEYLAFLDNDDELALDALYHVAKELHRTGADLVYSDEDLIGDDGTPFSTFYKPDYNPELLLCHNYITHLVVTSAELFASSGGFLTEMDGAQDFDLVLKLSSMAEKVHHIARVLYHWRASETSTSINHRQKKYADLAGKRAVEMALKRIKREGEVIPADWKFYYQPRYEIRTAPLVSIISVWQDNLSDGIEWIRSLCKLTTYSSYEILIVVTEVEGQLTQAVDEMRAVDSRVRIIFQSDSNSRAAMYSSVLSHAQGEFLAFVSAGIEVCSSDWLQALLQFAQFADTGFVSGRIQQDGDKEECVSTTPDVSNSSPRYYLQWMATSSQHMNGLHCSQEILMVSGELCLVGKARLEKCGGFKAERFPHLFGFADLSMELRRHGLRNIYAASCLAKRNSGFTPDRQLVEDLQKMIPEQKTFQNRWRSVLQAGDPFYNPGCYRAEGISAEEFTDWYRGV